MLASTITISTALTAMAAAFPVSNVAARAGGPAIVPIPSTCTISNPMPTASGTSFLPAPTTADSLLYSAYYPSFSTNMTLMSEQCLEQCYGYGDSKECKAAYWAENVQNPRGPDLITACLFYTRELTGSDFAAAPEGQGTGAYARNLAC